MLQIVGKFRDCAGCKRHTYNRVISQEATRIEVPDWLKDRPVTRIYRCVECGTEDLILPDPDVDLHIISTAAEQGSL